MSQSRTVWVSWKSWNASQLINKSKRLAVSMSRLSMVSMFILQARPKAVISPDSTFIWWAACFRRHPIENDQTGNNIREDTIKSIAHRMRIPIYGDKNLDTKSECEQASEKSLPRCWAVNPSPRFEPGKAFHNQTPISISRVSIELPNSVAHLTPIIARQLKK